MPYIIFNLVVSYLNVIHVRGPLLPFDTMLLPVSLLERLQVATSTSSHVIPPIIISTHDKNRDTSAHRRV